MLEQALLRICDGRGQTVGLGFLVSDTVALTCAHVVTAALGTPAGTPPGPDGRVPVDLPLVAGRPRAEVAVERWLPPRGPGDGPGGAGDVAVLRFDAPPPGARPVRLVDTEASTDGLWGHRVRAFGLPTGRPGGVWHAGVLRGRQADGWVQADLMGGGYAVSHGFSGGPVWDDRLSGVVGMVTVADTGETPASYLIPTDGLAAAWPALVPLVSPPSPFRGLTAFEEADAAVFHGRRNESDQVVGALAQHRWVTVVGPSGSGKSSLALAGVAPRLRARGACVAVVRPASGSTPLAALASALLPLLEPGLPETRRLARLPGLTDELRDRGLAGTVDRLLARQGVDHLLLVLDQLEEVLQQPQGAERELAEVLFAADALPPPVQVLATLRADFLEPVLSHPRLGPVAGRHLHALRPLDADGLREIVTAPVDALPGVSYAPGLAGRVLADTGTEPGALPLLALTLDLLWQRQEDGLLTHRAYDELGGVTGALGNHADRIWAEHVEPGEETEARRLFVQLVRLPLGSAVATRRLVRRGDLGEKQWHLAQRLAAHTRLLVTDRTTDGTETVELTHEALITRWEKLAAWVAEDRSFLRWRETVRHERDRWQEADHAPEHLPTAAALAGAEQWLPDREASVGQAEREYLAAGRARRRTRARRRRALLSGLATAVALTLVFSALYLVERRSSQERAALGASRALAQAAAAESSATDPAHAALLSLAAYDTSPTQEAENELLRQYLQNAFYDRVLSGDIADNYSYFDTSRDGEVVLTASRRSGAMLFLRALTGPVRMVRLPSPGKVRGVTVSADGKRAAYIRRDGRSVWFDVRPDAERPLGPLHRLPHAPGTATERNDTLAPALSADGTALVARVGKRLVRWNLESGRHGSVTGNLPAPGKAFKVWPAPDGRTLLALVNGGGASGQDSKSRLLALDPATGSSRVAARADTIHVSGDRTRAVLCHRRGRSAEISVHRLSDGAREGVAYREKDVRFASEGCPALSVDHSGLRVALSESSGLTVVGLRDGAVLSRNSLPSSPTRGTGHPWVVESGGSIYYVHRDESKIGYVPLSPGDWFIEVGQQALTRDGRHMITVLADGSRVQVHPTRGTAGKVLADVPRRKPYWVPESGDQLSLDRTGRLVAAREGAGIVTVREVPTLRRTATIIAAGPPRSSEDEGGPAGPENDLTYFFDGGGKLVTVSGTVVEQWDPRTGRRLARFDAAVVRARTGGAQDAQLRIGPLPEEANRVSVIVLDRPGIHLVDIATGRTVETVRTGDDILAAQFDPSGNYFAILRRGSVFELWRRGDPPRKELGPLRSLAEGGDTPYVASFLEGEGRYLVAANNALRIYRIGEPGYETFYSFVRPSDRPTRAQHTFRGASVDGSTVLHWGPDDTGGPLHLAPRRWYRDLCDIIGERELTAAEVELLPAEPKSRRPCAEGG
ncbi:serine protease [Streptomyces albidoflavus]|uniref:nSTAND1 domain-containing NTPase n=1 Tax=Streptomyces TaxID=1883 RepID=UPI001E5EEEAD|nr:trypsin-like peptidase domain-containing protein [Streptomyces sp. OUCMDZ-3434]WSB23606.1 serine protease [Streptomyces albidoflavus]